MCTTECVETHKCKMLGSALHEKGTGRVSLPLVCIKPQKRPRTKSDARTVLGASMDTGALKRTKTGRKENHLSRAFLSFPETDAATNDFLQEVQVPGASSPRNAPYSPEVMREASLHILEQMRSCEPDKDRWEAINPADYRAAALFSMLIENIVCRYDLGAYPYGIYGPPPPGMIVNVE
ncbi:hypothetical protein MVES1_000155 [Malassezia vespertilionis]|uniref:uncharacterized protein n=1 Tax=Malassezia vespertilionis TaxID=2020962 RepID=UPI0024B17ED3|nr:uncharacterized protein MVES1_000155 [Malassezia vespertilionis]WFD04831.1 hypothetical protein MVES1_000155 [Malassezia vespertilionis]